MSDEEQIRLLTEIRDTLKEQAAWTRETIQKRGRNGIIMVIVIAAFFVGAIMLVMQSARSNIQKMIEESQKSREPVGQRLQT